MIPTKEFILHLRCYAAWMPTIWGWVEGIEPPESPPAVMEFSVEGREDGNGNWISTRPPPFNSAGDMALLDAFGNPTILFNLGPGSIPVGVWEWRVCTWNDTLNRWEYTSPASAPPSPMWFHVIGDVDGNGTWSSTLPPPANSAGDITLLEAFGVPTLTYSIGPDTLAPTGEYDKECLWNTSLLRWEFEHINA